MATSYPSGIDNFTNPTAADKLDSVTVPHATQHANANDAIEAIENELGINPKGASASVSARLTTIESSVTNIAIFYTHTQAVSSSAWTINHNLNGYPTAVVLDSAGTQCEGTFTYPSVNQMVITFTSAFTGVAYVI